MAVPPTMAAGLLRAARFHPRLIPRRALHIFAALLFASACCAVMIVVRRHYAGEWTRSFLLWNLVLAWVPLPLAYAAYRMHTSRTRRNLLFSICALSWFFFFPNAPYITTDFIHLRQEMQPLVWLDIISIASFAWVGLCLGFCSLYLMQEIVGNRLGRAASWLFVLVMFAATSFGTFLGRFQRWNSWDVLHHPFGILADFSERLKHSPADIQVYLTMMFLFLLLSYSVIFAMMHLHEQVER